MNSYRDRMFSAEELGEIRKFLLVTQEIVQ